MDFQIERKPSLRWLFIGSLAIGLIGDYLFYGKDFGISYPLFVLCLYGLFFWQARERIHLRFSQDQAFAWLLTLPTFLLALTFFLYDNLFFHLLNFMIVPFLLVAQTMLLSKRHKREWHSFGFFGEIVEMVIYHTLRHTRIPFVLLSRRIKSRVDGTKYRMAKKVLTGIGISLPLLLVVLTLLSQADGVFGHFLEEIPRMLFDWDSAEALFRLVLVGSVALVSFGYLYSSLGPGQHDVAAAPVVREEKKIAWDGVIVVTILTIINVVYAAFTVIQISYLFGGAQSALPDGMTYAEYAKKGFNELVVVTIINFILLVSSMYLVSREKPLTYRIVQVLLSLLTVCTSFMLYSAYFRLSLYEEAYGYTYSRLLAHAFMVFLFVLFAIALLRIWRSGFSLPKYYGIAAIAAYVIVNYLNIDVVIAENNIQRYHETGEIDTEYLAGLSSDAVPVIMTLAQDKSVGESVMQQIREKVEDLEEESGWQSFNLARSRAKAYME